MSYIQGTEMLLKAYLQTRGLTRLKVLLSLVSEKQWVEQFSEDEVQTLEILLLESLYGELEPIP